MKIGYTADLRKRVEEHNKGKVFSTKNKGKWEMKHIKKIKMQKKEKNN